MAGLPLRGKEKSDLLVGTHASSAPDSGEGQSGYGFEEHETKELSAGVHTFSMTLTKASFVHHLLARMRGLELPPSYTKQSILQGVRT